jgi:hypothetical protein
VAFFAVLRDEERPLQFTVKACHINLWSLAALWGRRKLLLDVGLRLLAQDDPIDRLSIALPVATSAIMNISAAVLDQRTASLIFDEDVTLPEQNVIHLRHGNLEVRGIQESRSEPDKGRASRDFSLWSIRLDGNIEPHKEAYIRVRFPVEGHRSTWQWRRFMLAKYGALIDFRVADIRSTITVKDGTALLPRVIPIERLAFFVILPRWLRERATNPLPSYVRLLEGPVWMPYLNRKPEFRKRSKMVVYYWRGGGEREINPTRPFRVFLDLEREPGYTPLGSHLATTILVVIGVWLVFKLNVRTTVTSLVSLIGDIVKSIPPWFGLATVGGVITFILGRRIQAIAEFGRFVRRIWIHMEDHWWFRG